MKTKTFLSMSFISHIADVLTILLCVSFSIYLLLRIQLLNIEKLVIAEYTINLCYAAKLLIFLNLFIALLSSYAVNISSKLLMKYATIFSIFAQGCGLAAIAYFRKYYLTFFKSILGDKFYSQPRVSILLENYFPSKPYTELKELCVEKISDLIRILSIYEIITITLMLVSLVVLIISQNIKLTIEEEPVPAIASMSKVGLNTGSLRNKRIVDVVV